MKNNWVILLVLLAGCATSGTGNKKIMSADFQDAIQMGVSTQTDILALLGEPSKKEWHPDSSIRLEGWRYEGSDRLISPLCFIPLVDLTQKQTLRQKVVDVIFDDKGIVQDIQVQSKEEKRMFAIGTVSLIMGGLGAVAAAGPYAYAPYYARGYYYPGKAVINTIPTAGGGSMSTVKWYR